MTIQVQGAEFCIFHSGKLFFIQITQQPLAETMLDCSRSLTHTDDRTHERVLKSFIKLGLDNPAAMHW